ncbi:TPA: hypothetical protein DCY67_00340 [Candidatus Acetothermia bacterium]|nr:hypothetical protein [Candidatus Acetothermia bacterium]
MVNFGILFITGIALIIVASLAVAPPTPPLSPTENLHPITVVIDAGDGGRAPGAVVAGVQEKNINLAIALRVAAVARGDPRLRVVLTRTTDRFIEHRERLRIAEREQAVLFLSIQTNAAPATSGRGVETWVDDSRRPTDCSWKLAAAVQQGVIASTGAVDRGVRSQRLYMRDTHLPSVLLEVGFLTNPTERRLLLTPEYQDRIARGVVAGILDFLRL